jgi:hypothetical protein
MHGSAVYSLKNRQRTRFLKITSYLGIIIDTSVGDPGLKLYTLLAKYSKEFGG